MRICITGHTSGIGLSLYNKLKQQHTVIGYSRSNGYNIRYEGVRKKIISETIGFDIFINNAYDPEGQNLLLFELLNNYNSIVNISSNITTLPEQYISDYPELISYRSTKIISNNIIKNYCGPTNILNVLPDIVKTNFYLGKLNPKSMEGGLDPDYVADLIIAKIGSNDTLIITK